MCVTLHFRNAGFTTAPFLCIATAAAWSGQTAASEDHGLKHGHLYIGQLCRHFVFRQVDIMGRNTWDPNYAQALDFLDHIFFNLKNSGQDLSNEGSNFILRSLEVGH